MATSNFNFTLLTGSDQAGYNSINTLITSIDVELYKRATVPGMVLVLDTSITSAATMEANGWSSMGTAISGSGLPTLSSPYVYIKKVAS